MKAWVRNIFKADQAHLGGIVRRSRYYVDKYASIEDVVAAARQRGFHVIESGDQVVVLCHEGALKIHC